MTVHAPFRFAPINRWVHFPDWAHLVSHDVPFKDGLSGKIIFDIRAETPLLVGGARRKAGAQAGAVIPLKRADGRYAIPGSSLQGLVRSILEIAAFGKLGERIDDRRFGYRDVSSGVTPESLYRDRMTTNAGGVVTQHAKSGWLIKTADGAVIVPCSYARIQFAELAGLLAGVPGVGPNILAVANGAKRRYDWFLAGRPKSALNVTAHIAPSAPYTHGAAGVTIHYRRAYATAHATTTPTAATVVFTGKPQSGVGPGDKKMEFLFHSPDRAAASPILPGALKVSKEVWRDFELIHGEQPGRKANENWAFWKGEFDGNNPVPVFYLEEGSPAELTTFGTAFMFKAAMPLSTHDLLKSSSPEDHFSPRPDLPSLIFGWAADTAGGGLKRRASFDMAVTAEAVQPVGGTTAHHPAVLLSPKPNYFPMYVRQPTGAHGVLPNFAGGQLPYAAYAKFDDPRFSLQPALAANLRDEHKAPELSGVKIWPVVQDGCRFPQLEPPPQGAGASVQTRLTALPEGATFSDVKLRFHNLRPMELGALLWALTFGEREKLVGEGALRHRVGMGKPLGLGVLAISVKAVHLARGDTTKSPANLLEDFETYMKAEYSKSGDTGGWENSVQVASLLKAANSAMNTEPNQFRYMNLRTGADNYVGERTARAYLLPYASGGEATRGGPALAPHLGATILVEVRKLEGRITSAEADRKGRWAIDFVDGTTGLLKVGQFKIIAAAP